MRHARRPVALLISVALFQLMLLAGGYACVMGRTGASAVTSMGGMAMPASGTATQAASHGGEPPCEFPWAPKGCDTMTPCAPAALAVAATALETPQGRLAGSVLTLEPLAPESVSRTPELPPPRAQST